MRFFVVLEPRSINPLGKEHVEFVGEDILARDSRDAVRRYFEQRAHKRGRTWSVWVVDKLRAADLGPDTYTIRLSMAGDVEFYG